MASVAADEEFASLHAWWKVEGSGKKTQNERDQENSKISYNAAETSFLFTLTAPGWDSIKEEWQVSDHTLDRLSCRLW